MSDSAHPIPLCEMPLHQPARIRQIAEQNPVSERLAALGLLPGTTISICHIAPLGDPISIQVNNRQFAIRRSEAKLLLVQPL